MLQHVAIRGERVVAEVGRRLQGGVVHLLKVGQLRGCCLVGVQVWPAHSRQSQPFEKAEEGPLGGSRPLHQQAAAPLSTSVFVRGQT